MKPDTGEQLMPLREAYERLREEGLIEPRGYEYFREHIPRSIYGVSFDAEKRNGRYVVGLHHLEMVIGQALVERKASCMVEAAQKEALRIRQEYVNAQYDKGVLLALSAGLYTRRGDDFHVKHCRAVGRLPWKGPAFWGAWVCSHCFSQAKELHEGKECHACSDWNGCATRDCDLSAVVCEPCGTRLDL